MQLRDRLRGCAMRHTPHAQLNEDSRKQSRIIPLLSTLQSRANNTRKSSKNGFTLIELIITIVIVGILAAIAIPIYISQQAKARATCAQTQVAAIARQQQGFFAENNEFAADFKTLGVEAPIACTGYFPANVSGALIDASPETADGYCVKATLKNGSYSIIKFKGICGSG